VAWRALARKEVAPFSEALVAATYIRATALVSLGPNGNAEMPFSAMLSRSPPKVTDGSY
jgi:hypothetical protein